MSVDDELFHPRAGVKEVGLARRPYLAGHLN